MEVRAITSAAAPCGVPPVSPQLVRECLVGEVAAKAQTARPGAQRRVPETRVVVWWPPAPLRQHTAPHGLARSKSSDAETREQLSLLGPVRLLPWSFPKINRPSPWPTPNITEPPMRRFKSGSLASTASYRRALGSPTAKNCLASRSLLPNHATIGRSARPTSKPPLKTPSFTSECWEARRCNTGAASVRFSALSENSTKCPIGAGFRILGLRLKPAVSATAACRQRSARRGDGAEGLPG